MPLRRAAALTSIAVLLLSSHSLVAGESVPLFDGKTLAGWQGKAGLWSVVDGAIVGSTKPGGLQSNTFLVHEKPFESFILSLDFQLHGGNSGIQFRSSVVGKPEDFVVSGYQADLGEGYFGGLYDEKRRDRMLAQTPQDWVQRFAGPAGKALKPAGEWNHYEIRAIGNSITLQINQLITAEWVEKDDAIARKGIIALQLHAGGPMEARFKNIQIEEIQPKKLLYVTTAAGFAHSSRPLSREVTTKLGVDSGRFLVTATDTTELITPAGLKGFDAVMFYTTGGIDNFPLTKENREALIQWVKDGHAFVGVHSATDTYADWEPYWEMIGGSFDGHPWGAGDPPITVDVEDPSHPAAIPVPHGWKVQDEIYQFKNYSRDRLHIILSMNVDDEAHRKKGKRADNDYPLAWCREYHKGKVFHTSLGHREDVWTNPTYQAHLLGGILWALGTPGYESDATPGLPKPDNKFVDLLDGKTLSGWTVNDVADPKGPNGKKLEAEWEVVDGVLQGKGQHGHIFSPKEYVNFHYVAEAKINDGGNSGMYFRAQKGQSWPQGYEAQVNSTHGDPVRTGSLYNIEKVYEPLVPPDTWFTQEIIAYGDHIVIKVNGKVTANVIHSGARSGHFAFQFHDPTCKVQFKNVKVRELPTPGGKKTAKAD